MKADVRESPAYMMWLASNAWQRGLRRVLEPWNLTHVQFAVLSSVERLGGEGACLCQAEVARWLDIDENMNSQVIRSLERRKLLER
ncbi:MAG: MarR family winged helix-turn-helix transcriptional regulator, partial [Armatimonadota bacterium]